MTEAIGANAVRSKRKITTDNRRLKLNFFHIKLITNQTSVFFISMENHKKSPRNLRKKSI
jgi:hypothetical protein